MDRLDMDSFDLVYARMLFVAGRRTQSELADILGLRQGSISEAKKRGYVPMQWFVRVADAFNVEIDWLRFGKPPIFRKRRTRRLNRVLFSLMGRTGFVSRIFPLWKVVGWENFLCTAPSFAPTAVFLYAAGGFSSGVFAGRDSGFSCP